MSKALCPNPEVCGSCGWSQIPYQKQLDQKLGDINGSFKIHRLDQRVERILPAPKTAHYRNRMDFVISFEGLIGLREKGKWWKTIDNHPCFIADEQIDDLFYKVRDWVRGAGLSFYDRKATVGLLRYAVIRCTTLGEKMVSIVTSVPTPEEEPLAKTRLAELAASCGATTVLWLVNHTITDVSHAGDIRIISGPGYIEEEINGYRYRITPNAFFQTNSTGAAQLQQTVLNFAAPLGAKTVVDLYCGSGFFTLPLAKTADKVFGIEISEESIAEATTNAELNNVSKEKAEFLAAKTEDTAWYSHKPDLLIVDPPRAGLHDRVIADLRANPPKDIIYISCNYKSFARELVLLQDLYELSDATAIDMFPHTPHVELVAHLKRK